jgi:hypothetical protein
MVIKKKTAKPKKKGIVCATCGNEITEDSFTGDERYGSEGSESVAFCDAECAANFYTEEVFEFDDLKDYLE